MAAVLALAWLLPLAWWSVAATLSVLTAIAARVAWLELLDSSQAAARSRSIHSAACLWANGAIAAAYAGHTLTTGGETFSRLGYPFLVRTGLALPGGALLLLLIAAVAVTPIVIPSASRQSASASRFRKHGR